MAYKMNGGLRSAILDDVLQDVTKISIYNGAAPVNADAATSGTLLVELNVNWMTGTNWPAATNGTAKFYGDMPIGTAIADGTAGYARFTDNTYSFNMQTDSIGTTYEDDADLLIDSLVISSGGTVSLVSCTFIYPEDLS